MTKDKRAVWFREPGVHEVEIKGRKYQNLVRFTRQCSTCSERFGIYVSQAVADGHKSNNNFGLKNCEQHRAGSRASVDELNALKSWKSAAEQELASIYDRNRALFDEVQILKARLSKYELNETSFENALAEVRSNPDLTTNSGTPPGLTFPWQQS